VAADSGAMGGSTSAEFQVLAESGEDAIVACDKCSYAANVEVATVRSRLVEEKDVPLEEVKKVHTPGHGGIEDVVRFLKTTSDRMLKSLLYVAGEEVVMVVVRGDHDVNEVRLARALGVGEVFLASEADVKKATGAAVGFAGPPGFKGKILVDRAASLVKNGITGANETDHHVTGVNFERDYQGEIVDVRLAATGDGCPSCDEGKLTSYKGIEAGHIFILGTHYTDQMGATFLDESQQKKSIVMGCYGIGVSRLVATAIEQHNDAEGIRWPMSIAPYQVHLVTIGKDEAVSTAAQKIYDELWAKGVEVLWDDRDERPGVKFKDADLIGLPLRVTVGGKNLANGNVELKPRTEPDPKKSELVPASGVVERLIGMVKGALG
jgi:prolyl-tRNA synthetase